MKVRDWAFWAVLLASLGAIGAVPAVGAPTGSSSGMDVAVTNVEVRPVAPPEGSVGSSLWFRTISVEVTNEGAVNAPQVGLVIWVRTPSDGGCRRIHVDEFEVAPGDRVGRTLYWDGLGAFGDVEIIARISAATDNTPENDEMRVQHFVVAPGDGLGVYPQFSFRCFPHALRVLA